MLFIFMAAFVCSTLEWCFYYSFTTARISCRWQTHATHCITVNVLQTNQVDAQCDKLATKLSWEWFASDVTNLQLPHLHLAPPLGWPRLSYCRDFRHQKTSAEAILLCCLCDLDLAVLVECWLVTDGRTNRHTMTAGVAWVKNSRISSTLVLTAALKKCTISRGSLVQSSLAVGTCSRPGTRSSMFFSCAIITVFICCCCNILKCGEVTSKIICLFWN